MPQNPLQSNVAVHNGARTPLNLDANGNLLVSATSQTPATPAASAKNITAATVVKAVPGKVLTVTIVDDGSAGGFVHDAATTGTAAAANAILALPTGGGPLSIQANFPCSTGIVVAPGTGQVIAIAYE